MTYKNYFINKYKKYRTRNGKFLALIQIIIFTINKLVCYLLINFISKRNKTRQLLNKKILFIEPIGQGFGDLLFQTPLFRSWSENGYTVNILLAKKRHADIIRNNPYIEDVFTWSIIDLFRILFMDYESLFGLCRDSVRENLLLISKISSNKILPDFDLALWEETFLANSNTIAWQIITNKINPNLHSRGIPQIFFSKSEERYISRNKNGKIVIVVGVENKFKQMPGLTDFLSYIPNNFLEKVVLTGRGENYNVGKLPVKNLINKLTYRENLLEIASADFVFGPEGSLVHAASVLGTKTAIWDPEKLFIKNAHPLLLHKGNLFFIYSKGELKSVIEYMNLSFEAN